MTTKLRLGRPVLITCFVASGVLGATVTSGGCAKGSEFGDGLDGGITGVSPGSSGSGSSDGGHVIIIGASSSSSTSSTSEGCATCNSSSSSGTGSSCVNGEMMCSAGCTDTSTDPDNCGFCGNPCDGGTCVNSACTGSSGCPDGEMACTDGCSDTTSDPDNCGFCGNECPSGSCTGSQCDMSTGSGDGGSGSGYTCTHSPCTVGAALMDGCDDDTDFTVSSICEGDQPQCCTTAWTQECVDEATSDCGTGSGFDECTDPGC